MPGMNSTDEKLWKYAKLGDLEGVRKMIQKGGDVNWENGDVDEFFSPLMMAVSGGHVEVIELLLQYKADVNKQNNCFLSPLHIAVENGKVKVAKVLLRNGADVNKLDWFGYTPLYIATKTDHMTMANMLLENGAHVNATCEFGNTSLHIAAENGQVAVAIALLKSGANLNATCEFGNTPLHIAIREGHVNVAKVLLKCGANPNARDRLGRTAMCFAKSNKNADIMVALLDPYTSLTRGLYSKNRDIVQGILRQSITQQSVSEMIARSEDAKSAMESLKDSKWKRTLTSVLHDHRLEMLYFAFLTGDTEQIDVITNWINGNKEWMETTRFSDELTLMQHAAVYRNLTALKAMISFGLDPYKSINAKSLISEAEEDESSINETRDMIVETMKVYFKECTQKLIEGQDMTLSEQAQLIRSTLLCSTSMKDIGLVMKLAVCHLQPETLKPLVQKGLMMSISRCYVYENDERNVFIQINAEMKKRKLISQEQKDYFFAEMMKINVENADWVQHIKQSVRKLDSRQTATERNYEVLKNNFKALTTALEENRKREAEKERALAKVLAEKEQRQMEREKAMAKISQEREQRQLERENKLSAILQEKEQRQLEREKALIKAIDEKEERQIEREKQLLKALREKNARDAEKEKALLTALDKKEKERLIRERELLTAINEKEKKEIKRKKIRAGIGMVCAPLAFVGLSFVPEILDLVMSATDAASSTIEGTLNGIEELMNNEEIQNALSGAAILPYEFASRLQEAASTLNKESVNLGIAEGTNETFHALDDFTAKLEAAITELDTELENVCSTLDGIEVTLPPDRFASKLEELFSCLDAESETYCTAEDANEDAPTSVHSSIPSFDSLGEEPGCTLPANHEYERLSRDDQIEQEDASLADNKACQGVSSEENDQNQRDVISEDNKACEHDVAPRHGKTNQVGSSSKGDNASQKRTKRTCKVNRYSMADIVRMIQKQQKDNKVTNTGEEQLVTDNLVLPTMHAKPTFVDLSKVPKKLLRMHPLHYAVTMSAGDKDKFVSWAEMILLEDFNINDTMALRVREDHLSEEWEEIECSAVMLASYLGYMGIVDWFFGQSDLKNTEWIFTTRCRAEECAQLQKAT